MFFSSSVCRGSSTSDLAPHPVAAQAVLAERNADLPQDRRMLFRIGINLGDVLVESDVDLLGDGVNVAAPRRHRRARWYVHFSVGVRPGSRQGRRGVR
jgi:hypothetical protein